jgi:hypothetical protein
MSHRTVQVLTSYDARVASGQGSVGPNGAWRPGGGGSPAAMADAAEEADLGTRLRWYESRRGASSV